MTSVGRKRWAVAGGRIPLAEDGYEELCVLNAGSRDAEVRLTVYYADRAPVGPYRLAVPGRRIRHVRMNDLIDPLPIPLDEEYGLVVESDVPVVVRLSRFDPDG